MKVLLVYPRNPDTFWSFKHVLKFVSKKAAFPPLGLLTVAGMLPPSWSLRLVDVNVSVLTDEQIRQADYVFISGMIVHKQSAQEIARLTGKGSQFQVYRRLQHVLDALREALRARGVEDPVP